MVLKKKKYSKTLGLDSVFFVCLFVFSFYVLKNSLINWIKYQSKLSVVAAPGYCHIAQLPK